MVRSKAFVLKEKLKQLRDRMRWWNKNMFGKIELKIEEVVIDLNRVDNSITQS